ncbi:putative tripartite motif-containing protein 61 [Ailuropoda melanoleuca]|uniref:putative tripartite motif-containing protein 61 n=1 Tax=Ailuropoda melanoleuca TaxID=9646 RepID=UPI0014945C5F|nr:putative tripartite motif-containing protein 61 [Ailuropoda melanoleuca]
MPFTASLAELQVEASCPTCLGYLRDPVTTDCGHNFCGSCNRQCWEDLQDTLPCPVCLHHCPDRNLKRNIRLGHVTGIVKRLPTRRSKRRLQAEKALCEQHSQALALFCEKDLELLCPQCKVSSGLLLLQGPPLMPTKQAALATGRSSKDTLSPCRSRSKMLK